MSEITPYGFQHTVRSELRFSHGFEHHELEAVHGMYKDVLEKMGRSSLEAHHFDEAMKHMEEHPVWQKLSHSQRNSVISTFQKHVGITPPAPEAANDAVHEKAA